VLLLADLLVADGRVVLAVKEVEVELVLLDRAVDADRRGHQAERDRARPDRTRLGSCHLEPPRSLVSEFPLARGLNLAQQRLESDGGGPAPCVDRLGGGGANGPSRVLALLARRRAVVVRRGGVRHAARLRLGLAVLDARRAGRAV